MSSYDRLPLGRLGAAGTGWSFLGKVSNCFQASDLISPLESRHVRVELATEFPQGLLTISNLMAAAVSPGVSTSLTAEQKGHLKGLLETETWPNSFHPGKSASMAMSSVGI